MGLSHCCSGVERELCPSCRIPLYLCVILFSDERCEFSGKTLRGRAKDSLSFPFPRFSQTIGKVLMQYADILSKNFPAYCTKEKMVRIRPWDLGEGIRRHLNPSLEAILRTEGGDDAPDFPFPPEPHLRLCHRVIRTWLGVPLSLHVILYSLLS